LKNINISEGDNNIFSLISSQNIFTLIHKASSVLELVYKAILSMYCECESKDSESLIHHDYIYSLGRGSFLR